MVTDRILAESRCLVMCAGGMITSSLSHPMDTLKCRWQVAGKPWQGQHLTDFARALLREEGISAGLWRPGFLANVMSMAWCVGMRNGLYPTFRDGIGKLYTIAGGEPGKAGPSSMFCAGLLSGCSGYLVASPLLQVKTQMQAEAGKLGLDGLYASGLHVGLAPTYSSTWQALASHSCGSLGGSLRSLWRGAGVIVARGAALSASQLMAYDQSKTVLKERKVLRDGPMLHVASSLIAAVVCTTCHMPFDVVLTMYQSAQSLGGAFARYGATGPQACAALLIRESGPGILFRGWVPAFLRLAPVCVFSFGLYEQLRQLVGIGYLD
ncbi:unnamed protein product [Effrenium voratum]|nr:unnamed protein product [Effrenium voratum]